MKGTVVYLYAFDVANEIRTSSIRELMSEKPFPFQIRVGPTVPKDVRIYQPLTIGLKPEELDTNVGHVTLKRFVKVFDIGVISISYELPFQVAALSDLIPYHDLRSGATELHQLADRLLDQVTENLRPYMEKENPERAPAEAYTVFCLEELDGARAGGVPEWAAAHRREIASLLNEEAIADRLAEDQIEETLRPALSYTSNDLTVVDWDAAFVVDQSGYYDDVLYVIELANLQLEEFRLLDDRLDRYFLRAYDDIERYYARLRLVAAPGKILRTLRSIRMDITKMSEEATNITKFVGDWYLARVYLACRDRFHVGHWERSVDEKLLQLDHVYSLVHTEINNRRMLILEVIIVALFLFDVIVVLFYKH